MAETNMTPTSGPAGLPYLLTVEQTADLLGIGTTLVHEKTKLFLDSGGLAVDGIPAVRIGRCKRVPRDRLLEWIDNGCMNIPSAPRGRAGSASAHGRRQRSCAARREAPRATARSATAVPSHVRSIVTPSDASPLSTRTVAAVQRVAWLGTAWTKSSLRSRCQPRALAATAVIAVTRPAVKFVTRWPTSSIAS